MAFAVVIVMGGGALLLLAATVGLVLLVTRGSVPSPSEAAAAARRHGTVVNVTGWVVAVVLAPLALTVVSGLAFPDDARAFTAALVGAYPAIVGLAYLGVHAVGERTWPRPAGPVRRAALVHRRVADVAPAWARRTLHGLVAAALAVLVTGGLTAAPDGRSIAVERYVGDMYAAHTASPYPGWDFAVPLLVAVALVAVAAEGVLRLVARRPAIVDADPAYDAASRRLSAQRALRGAILVIGCTLGAVLFVAGVALQGVELRALGAGSTVLGLLVGLASLVLAVVPAQPAPVTGPALAGPTPADAATRSA